MGAVTPVLSPHAGRNAFGRPYSQQTDYRLVGNLPADLPSPDCLSNWTDSGLRVQTFGRPGCRRAAEVRDLSALECPTLQDQMERRLLSLLVDWNIRTQIRIQTRGVMNQLLPDWNSLHQLVVHSSVVVLLVAPLLVLLGGVLPLPAGRPFLTSALILMAIGAVLLLVALETGGNGIHVEGETAEIKQILRQHEDLAETTYVLFLALTGAFAHIVILPRLLKRELSRALQASLLAAFLMLYAAGALLLVNTANQGWRLARELSVGGHAAPSSEQAHVGTTRANP